jgi:hypothetical protein
MGVAAIIGFIQPNAYRFRNLRQKAYAWLSGGLSENWVT